MAVLAITLVIFLALMALMRVVRSVPLKELRRHARKSESGGVQALYKVASYGRSLDVFLWIFGSINFALLISAAADIERWLVVPAIFLAAWLLLPKHPARPGGLTVSVAKTTAHPVSWVISPLHPLLMRLAELTWLKTVRGHTGAYEKDDLIELIKVQHNQDDNRVNEIDLQAALGALSFGDKTVGSAMTPRRKVKTVAVGDAIGPHLMDELHESGFSRFPVLKDSTKTTNWQIVGTLYLHDLVGHPETGKVKDLMSKKVFFINEGHTLRQALDGFLKTHSHLLVVVNNFEEMVGVISLEDVLEQILGQPIVDEFDHYGDLRAVAGLEAKKDHTNHKQVAGPKSEVIE